MKNKPHIAILMATYNGATFLTEQLASILAQGYENWHLTASDDASTDGTLDILRRYKAENPGRVTLTRGPHQGFVDNFMALTVNADPNVDYYAWSDQDDVWLPEKLEMAMAAIVPYGHDRPALYCGRTIITDSAGREYGLSPLMDRYPPSFSNALVQCLAGGNTMVFNGAARELILRGQGYALASHDWWAYMVVSGAGGEVVYDPRPTVRYRQTGENTRGSNRDLMAKVIRLRAVAQGAFREWTNWNITALMANGDVLTSENRRLLMEMVSLHEGDGSLLSRLKRLRQAGFHRQSVPQSAFLCAMVAFGWL